MVPDAHSNPTLECHRGNGILFAIIRPSLYQHINNMNSVLRFPTFAYQSIVHSLKSTTPSTCSSRQDSIKMVKLPPRYRRPDERHSPSGRSTHRTQSHFNTFPRHQSRAPAKPTGLPAQPQPAHADNINNHHPREPVYPLPLEPSLSTSPPQPTTYHCTFCWKPHHSATTPSKVVGRHARLACDPCYNALLDLAVC